MLALEQHRINEWKADQAGAVRGPAPAGLKWLSLRR